VLDYLAISEVIETMEDLVQFVKDLRDVLAYISSFDYTVKRLPILPFPAGMSLTKLFQAGNNIFFFGGGGIFSHFFPYNNILHTYPLMTTLKFSLSIFFFSKKKSKNIPTP
jgi:hypothetical protein